MDNTTLKNIKDIWALAQNGDHAAAKSEVINLLRTQPNLVPAWLLLAELLDTTDEKAQCYQKVLEIDANNDYAIRFLEHINSSPSECDAVDGTLNIPSPFDDDDVLYTQLNTHAQSENSDADLGEEEIEDDENSDDNLTREDELTHYVIQELGDHVDPDDIIREVCLRSEMDWNQAEEFVNQITSKHALTIAKRRSPLRLIIAIPTLIVGVVWFIYTIITILLNGDSTLSVIFMLLQSYGHFIGSIAMMLGGSLGIYRVLKSLGKIG